MAMILLLVPNLVIISLTGHNQHFHFSSKEISDMICHMAIDKAKRFTDLWKCLSLSEYINSIFSLEDY